MGSGPVQTEDSVANAPRASRRAPHRAATGEPAVGLCARLRLCGRGASLAVALGALACTTATEGGVGEPYPTLVEILPDDFLEGLPCVDAPGAPRRYTATLTDTEAAAAGTPSTLTASASCVEGLAFAAVTVGHHYTMSLAVFDTTDPLVTAPAWTTTCATHVGEEPGQPGAPRGVVALSQTAVPVTPCEPLVRETPYGVTALSLDARAAFTDRFTCSSPPPSPDETTITSFDAAPAGSPLPGAVNPCGASVVFSSLTPGAQQTYKLFASNATGSWFSTCYQTTLEGMTLPASCDPLATSGLLVDLASAVLLAPSLCPSANPSVDAVLYDASVLPPVAVATKDRLPCSELAFFDQLSSGSAVVCLANGGTTAARCTATVSPGHAVEAACAATSSCP